MLAVIEDRCENLGRKATIVIEGDNRNEVGSADARMLALQKGASFGMTKPGISGTSGPYPANAVLPDGTVDESVMLQARPPGGRTRQDYDVTAAQ